MGSVGNKQNNNNNSIKFNMPTDITSKPKRSDVPILKNVGGRFTIDTNELRGHVMEYNGTPFFLQKTAADGYVVNVYGMIAGRIQKLSEAQDAVKKLYENLQKTISSRGNAKITWLDDLKERFNFVNVEGGRTSQETKEHMREWEKETLEKRRKG